MKIVYIFTATGKYSRFIDGLVTTGIKNFFPTDETEFIVFTDSEFVYYDGKLKYVEQKKIGWPYDTLMRFHFINSIKDILLKYDYVFYGNANMIFNQKISHEILPDKDSNGLIGSVHPDLYNTSNNNYPYERNNKSLAYIPYGEGYKYYQGCFFGGRKESFLEMTQILENNIQKDLDKEIIAIWHDESHLNNYFSKNIPKSLDSGYIYPESSNIPFEKRIIQLDKRLQSDFKNLRD